MTYTDERVDCEEGARGNEGGPMFAIYLTIGPVENNAALRQACHGRRAGADGGGGVHRRWKESALTASAGMRCPWMIERRRPTYLPTYLIT